MSCPLLNPEETITKNQSHLPDYAESVSKICDIPFQFTGTEKSEFFV